MTQDKEDRRFNELMKFKKEDLASFMVGFLIDMTDKEFEEMLGDTEK